jgi:repressor LexA
MLPARAGVTLYLTSIGGSMENVAKNSFYENFAVNVRRLRKERGLSQQELADLVGVTRGTISLWERGESFPAFGSDYPARLNTIFGTDSTLLFDPPFPRNAIPMGEGSKATLPLYGKITAGQPIEMNAVIEELQLSDDVRNKHPRGFFLEVVGDSMDRIILRGGYALIDPDKKPHSGDVVAANVNGYDATLKRYSKTADKVYLTPDSSNPEHGVIEVCSNDARVLGKMVWVQYPIEFRY